MSNLTRKRPTAKSGCDDAFIKMLGVPVAASAHLYSGGVVAINASGYLGPATATGFVDGAIVLGVLFCDDIDNSSGLDAAVTAEVERGAFWLDNSTSTDALTVADVGKPCYLTDDHTVARKSAVGARMYAGRVLEISSSLGVLVELGVSEKPGDSDLYILAGADLSAAQYMAVKASSTNVILASAAGEVVMGILQNAPASGAVAIVRNRGVSKMIAGGALATIGTMLATTSAGKAKAVVTAKVDTSDSGAAADPVIGSYAIGQQLTVASGADVAFQILITHSGLIPTTAA